MAASEASAVLLLLTVASLAFCTAVVARDLHNTRFLSETQQIPASIAAPQHYTPHLSLHARGYQHYCFNGTGWEFSNATAKLYDYSQSRSVVGRHFYQPTSTDARGSQPTWESLPSSSGGVAFSSVTCKAVAKVAVAEGSIPWVLLESTQSTGSGKYFGEVAFVQRINTKHGIAPVRTAGDRAGDVKKSPYTADYLFYVAETQHR